MTIAEFPAPLVREPKFRLTYFHDIQPHSLGVPLIRDFLMPGEFSVFHGTPGCRKTFCAIDIALCVATGTEWRGRPVSQGPVIYLAAEAGKGILNRFAAQKVHRGLEDANIPLAVLPSPIDLCHEEGDTQAVIDLIQSAVVRFETPVKLIVVDTLSRALAGGDENASMDMGGFVKHIDRIREATDAHLLVVHHNGKDASGKGGRGHSCLWGAVDTAVEILPDSVSAFSTATVYKQRELASGWEFSFSLDVVDLSEGEDGTKLTSCVVHHIESDETTSKKRKPPKGKAKLALAELNNCLADFGTDAPDSPHIPRGVTCVTKSIWRDHLEKREIINAAGNPRQEMQRIFVTLQESGFIGNWGDFVWSVT